MKVTIHALEVWGDFACFSRPDMGKVERWSYPCPTPSAVRGVFDAIYSKPNRDAAKAEFRWQVTKIELLAMPAYIALRRNEVKDTANVNAVYKWMAGKEPPEPIWADGDKALLGSDEKGRTQRQTMALREPRFRLHARIVPWPGFERELKGFDEQFIRRASHGKCFQQPYFGCREFVAYFKVTDTNQPQPPPVAYDQEIGLMLYDVFDLSRPGTSMDKPFVTLFRARIEQGVIMFLHSTATWYLSQTRLPEGGPTDARSADSLCQQPRLDYRAWIQAEASRLRYSVR